MTDILSTSERSYRMSLIKGKDTKPELALRVALWQLGCRYRLKSNLPGKPDIVYPKQKIAVFVDGCFWHGCPKHLRRPKSNQTYWNAKIQRNMDRDKQQRKSIRGIGWKVIAVWEHEIKANVLKSATKIKREIQKRSV